MEPNCASHVHMCRCDDTVANTPLPVLISIDKKLHILSRPALEGPDGTRDAPRLPSAEEVTEEGESTSVPGTPKFTPEVEGASNNILAYVSVLAAVVLGLLLYVAYKW